jgi:hypothetical protein
MRLLTPAAPPYDPRRWVTLPLEERGRLACGGWALQGYGTPLGGRSLAYQIHDAATGRLEAGEIEVAPLRKVQPWAAA